MATLTWEEVRGWDAATMRKNIKDPAIKAEIDRVAAERTSQVAAQIEAGNSQADERAALRAAAQQRRETEIKVAAEAKALDDAFLLSLPEDKRLKVMLGREVAAKKDRQEAESLAVIEAKRLQKRDEWLHGQDLPPDMLPRDRDPELARRRLEYENKIAEKEAATIAAAEAAANAPAKEAEEKATAEAAEVAQKAAADKVAADAAEAQKLADETALAEKARIAAEEAAKPKQKIIEDFQATDENGNPIGKRTHLEADTEVEMRDKMRNSYQEAVRYAERQKRKKAQMIQAQPRVPLSTLTAEEQKKLQEDLTGDDEVRRAVAENRLAADRLKVEANAAAEQREFDRQHSESLRFMQNHLEDFKPCQANADILGEYFKANNLEWNTTNLEIAFEDETINSRLAKPEPKFVAPDPATVEAELRTRVDLEVKVQLAAQAKARADAEVAAAAKLAAETEAKRLEQEKQAAITAAALASVAPTAPAAGSTPAEKTATATIPVAAERKLPASGIEPGSLHGGRAVPSTTTAAESGAKTLAQIKQDIARMPLVEYKKKLKDPAFKKLLNSVGIRA